MAVEYTIDSRGGGSTRVRVVQSGFGGDGWDETFDATKGGWQYFLFNLRHCLERHPGLARGLVWERRPMREPRAAAWQRLFGREGLGLAPDPMAAGSAFNLSLEREGSPACTVVMSRPPVHFAGLLPALNDATLFLELEPGATTWHLGAWLSTYGLADARVESLRTALGATLDRLFPKT